jgi:hypothetical protein
LQGVAALERVYKALAPGGWLVFGLYAPPPNALGEAHQFANRARRSPQTPFLKPIWREILFDIGSELADITRGKRPITIGRPIHVQCAFKF